jgi:hypothetical protein
MLDGLLLDRISFFSFCLITCSWDLSLISFFSFSLVDTHFSHFPSCRVDRALVMYIELDESPEMFLPHST